VNNVEILGNANAFTGVTLTASDLAAVNFVIYGDLNTATTAALTAEDSSVLSYSMNSTNTITGNSLTSSDSSSLTYNMPYVGKTDNTRVAVSSGV
jgi:hypothetical protein